MKQETAPYRVQRILGNTKIKSGCKMKLPGLWYFDIIALEHIEQSTTTAEWQV